MTTGTKSLVTKTAGALNFNARPLRLELEALDRLRLPAILHWDLRHFVVLTRVKGQTAFILRLRKNAFGKRFVLVATAKTPKAKASRRSSVRLPRLANR